MSKRRIGFLVFALLVLVLGRMLSKGGGGGLERFLRGAGAPGDSSDREEAPPGDAAGAPAPSARLRRPPASTASLGVLVEGSEADAAAWADRAKIADALVGPLGLGASVCGDASACDAVRSTLLDEHATALASVPLAEWAGGALDVDAGLAALPATERARAGRASRVIAIRVSTATSPRQLALRAAFAAAGVVATKAGGWVLDPLLGRVEGAVAFAGHAVTSPLEASVFRRDRVAVRDEPREEGVVRLLTFGLSRWGAPDVEMARVPRVARDRAAELLLAVAAAVAGGLEAGPCVLSREDLARVRGEPYPPEADLPPVTLIPVDLVSVQGEPGDPNDFIARVRPAGGDGPVGTLDLAERFFGPLLETPEAPDAALRQAALGQLDAMVARWAAGRASGARLLVRLPFAIPGDAGVESMWVEVTRAEGPAVSGVLLDEPLGATDVARGDAVTRPRADVEAVKLLGAGD